MSQIFDPIPNNQTSARIICCYVNATSEIQVARITNIENWYFERVVFPGQRLVFEALPEALLEIHSGMMASSILSDTIPCRRLWINKNANSEMNEPTEKKNQHFVDSLDNKSEKITESLNKTLVTVV